MKNYVAAVVVAVPMCRPARPAKGASIVSGAERIGGNMLFAHGSASFVGGNATFSDGNTSFWYGNAAARTFGRAHRHRPYHSKHTSPFRKDENKSFNACIAYANGKMQKIALA